MNLFLKTIFVLTTIMLSCEALAVVQLQVNFNDVPAMRSSTFEAISIDGEDVAVESSENEGAGFIELDYESPEEARGSAVIITPGNNRPAFQVTIPMDWAGSPLRVDFESQSLRPGEPLERRSVSRVGPIFGIAYSWADYATTDWGTPAGISRGAGDEIRVLPSESDISTNGYGLSYDHPLSVGFTDEVDMRIGVRYWEFSGDDSDSAQVAPGDADVFSVFIGIEDTYGTGFFGGPIGIDTRYDLDWESEQYGVGFSWASDCEMLGNVEMRPTVEFFWGDIELEYDARAQFVDVPDIVVTTHQQLESEYWGVELGADFRLPLSQSWSLDWSAGLRYQEVEADLMSLQDIDFFGMPSSIRVDSEDDDTSLGVYASVGTTFYFNDHISLSATIQQDWGTSFAGGVNPVSGTPVSEGQTAEVDYTDDSYLSTGVRLDVRF